MIRLLAYAVYLILIGTVLAVARDDGRYANSPLKGWFNQLASKNGLCCSVADGKQIDDVDWDVKDGHYRVHIYDQWIDVPDVALIPDANRFGPAVVWPWRDPITNQILIRCFMPGAGT